MGKLTYKKMSLFDAPEGSILLHASNAQGVWGSGIAKEFKERYPQQYEVYKRACEKNYVVGRFIDCSIYEKEPKHLVCTIVTSKGFASNVDPNPTVLTNTKNAVKEMIEFGVKKFGIQENTVYSNKFNSGLFQVPWENTEKIIKEQIKNTIINWIVCDPGMEEEIASDLFSISKEDYETWKKG